jgi:hypothetical protein
VINNLNIQIKRIIITIQKIKKKINNLVDLYKYMNKINYKKINKDKNNNN